MLEWHHLSPTPGLTSPLQGNWTHMPRSVQICAADLGQLQGSLDAVGAWSDHQLCICATSSARPLWWVTAVKRLITSLGQVCAKHQASCKDKCNDQLMALQMMICIHCWCLKSLWRFSAFLPLLPISVKLVSSPCVA